MKIKKGMIFLILFFVMGILPGVFNSSGYLGAAENDQQEIRIIILHVNDMHAQIDNFPKIAWLVREERKQNRNVFLMDAGDNFTGNPVVDQATPKGEPVRQLMYKMGFNIMELGNHEFDLGQENLKRFIKEANFPVISANIKVESGTFPQPAPFAILKTAEGISMAVLGLIQVDDDTGIPSTLPDNVKGLKFLDPIEIAKQYRFLKKQNPIFIALTHLGADVDEKLAKEMGELDLIVGGHSHTIINQPPEENGVLIAQAGGQAKYVGRIELIFKNGKIIKKSGQLIPISSIQGEDPELKEMVRKYNDNPVLNQVIAHLPRAIKGKMELGHLTTDAERVIYGFDAVFHNSGGLRTDILKKEVHLKDVFALHPFGNVIIQVEMTPAEIRSLIANDYEKHRDLDLKVSGITYIVTATRGGKVKNVEIRDRKGNLLNENRKYKVGMNDYIASSYKFDHTDPGKSLMVTVADTVIKYLKEYPNVCDGLDQRRTFESIAPTDRLTQIGETKVEIRGGQGKFTGSHTAGNLAADALKWAANADIAIFPGHVVDRSLIINAGSPFYKEYVNALYQYCRKNKTVTVRISGKDLKEFIHKQSMRKANADFQAAGIHFTVYVRPDGRVTQVNFVLPNGKPVSDTAIYKVVLNDYEFDKYYKLQDKVKDLEYGNETIEKMIIDYIKKFGIISKDITEKRVKVIHN